MTWITTTIDTQHLDQDSDLVLNARPAIKQTADNVNLVKEKFDIASIQNNQSLRYNTSTGALEPVLLSDTVTGFTAQQFIAQSTLTPSSTVNWDLDANQTASITLNQSITLANPTNQQAGATYTLLATQDSTGARTITFGSDYLFPEGLSPTLSVDADAVDLLVFYSTGTKMLGTLMRNYS